MDARIASWWDAVLAGEGGEPHPVYGERISIHVAGERLEISGELERREDRDQLLEEARARVGHGIRDVDTSRLTVAQRRERPGVLEQTLVASFPDPATAELARKFVLEHGRATPKGEAVVDHQGSAKLRDLLPPEFVEDAKKRLDRGEALLILRIDETDAFRVRALLDEGTRSKWTIATPPEIATSG